MDAILVINAGSSSLKFQVFGVHDGELRRHLRGQLEAIGLRPRLQATGADGAVLVDRQYASMRFPTSRRRSRWRTNGCAGWRT
jgi:acetate kinase